ncbi:uncharacterized protein [Paramisgurnus dabryanus]|uniref:uncharacterized protein n=1 Tax=Paramisgurnus dabryanus TaxID=90735 RepID=UPI0031F40ACD
MTVDSLCVPFQQIHEMLKMVHTFLLLCLWFCCMLGVFGDEVKSVSVMEGDSVTLYSNVTEIQKIQLILWKFGPQETRIVQINGEAKISIYADVLDGKFRDRLQVNNQTGDLTITNTRTTDSGLYEMSISITHKIPYRFNVTVYEQSRTSYHIVVICCVVGSVMIVALVLIFWIYRKHRNTNQQVQTGEEEITYVDPIFCKRQTHQSKAPVEDEVLYSNVMRR